MVVCGYTQSEQYLCIGVKRSQSALVVIYCGSLYDFVCSRSRKACLGVWFVEIVINIVSQCLFVIPMTL